MLFLVVWVKNLELVAKGTEEESVATRVLPELTENKRLCRAVTLFGEVCRFQRDWIKNSQEMYATCYSHDQISYSNVEYLH